MANNSASNDPNGEGRNGKNSGDNNLALGAAFLPIGIVFLVLGQWPVAIPFLVLALVFLASPPLNALEKSNTTGITRAKDNYFQKRGTFELQLSTSGVMDPA
ncbi:hypothetical protein [Corynebacterium lubricantis]|uniref:hypothetical protein n=1 Tax=Corynebacterium lubricantis TaxID=541095 RepID=UPI0012EA9B4E|nr:hypothetical protein [Corynebacterium lubricantis]